MEFLRGSGIASKRLYVYDGLSVNRNQYGYQDVRQMPQYGTESNPHVWVMREFVNSEANHLGMPLPKGRVRFYRRDQDGQLEFTGENEIDHTAKDETIRVYTGNAFDIAGERRQTHYQMQGPYPNGVGGRELRNQAAQPQERGCHGARCGASVSLVQLGDLTGIRPASSDRQPDYRVRSDAAT